MNERIVNPEYAIFRSTPEARSGLRIQHGDEERFRVHLWRPSWLHIRPAHFAAYPFILWWIAHHSRLFSTPDYSIVIITEGDKLAHRSCIFPKFFRFPFMRPGDLQVGDTWTAPHLRGQGLGAWALTTAMAHHPDRTFWYITEVTNLPSIRVALNAGLCRAGIARRFPRAGVALLGYYALDESGTASRAGVGGSES